MDLFARVAEIPGLGGCIEEYLDPADFTGSCFDPPCFSREPATHRFTEKFCRQIIKARISQHVKKLSTRKLRDIGPIHYRSYTWYSINTLYPEPVKVVWFKLWEPKEPVV